MDWPTVIIGTLVIGAMVAVVLRLLFGRKKGDSPCITGCGGCSSSDSCGAYQAPPETERQNDD